MKKVLLITITLLLITSINAQDVAFINVNIIPMDSERVLEEQTLLIKDGVISEFGDSSIIKLPENAQIIDANGSYIMPGIADMHVHIRNADELVNYLAYGVTTVMHMGGTSNQGKNNLRLIKEIKQGKMIGPKIYTTERIFDGDPAAAGSAYKISDPALAVELINELNTKGYDFIKLYNNISRQVFNTIIKEANRLKLPVVGHVSRKFDPIDAINNGQDMIAHTEELFFTYFKGPRSTENYDKAFKPDLGLVPELVKSLKKNNVAIIPNLSYAFTDLIMWDDVNIILADPEIKYVAPILVRNEFISGNINRRSNIENFIHRDQKKYQLSSMLTYEFQKAGILQLLGTDATQAGLFPGKSVHRELTELVKTGLGNYEVLSIATKNAGKFAVENNLRNSNFGQIIPGFIADMILVEENPLDDIRNTKLIKGVITNGRWISIEEIDERRSIIASKYASINKIETMLKASLIDNSIETKMKELIHENQNSTEILRTIESNINRIGYAFMAKKEIEKALEIFELNTKYFENSANAWDSYAEAHLSNNDKANAIKYYTKALEVNPNLNSAKQQLKLLNKD